MKNKIKIIDIFAGPGGLGEGFFSLQRSDGSYPFEGLISVEKDPYAHATLTLRAFYRQLNKANLEIPKEYYQYASGEVDSPATPATLSLWEAAKKETSMVKSLKVY